MKITLNQPALAGDALPLRQVGSILTRSPATLEKLPLGGYVERFDISTVLALGSAPIACVEDGELTVLRTKAAEPSTDDPFDRQHLGASAWMSDSDLLAGSDRWWRCDPKRVIANRWMAVTIAGFVVAVLRVEGLRSETGNAGQQRFAFEAELAGRIDRLVDRSTAVWNDDVARQLLGCQLSASSGGPVAYVGSIQ